MKVKKLSGDADLTRLECIDDLTLLEAQQSPEPLESLLGPGGYAGKVLLSLAGAAYIDSAGIGWLVLTHKHFLQAGGRLVIHSLSPLAWHVFNLLGLETILHVARDEAAARALLAADRSLQSAAINEARASLPPA